MKKQVPIVITIAGVCFAVLLGIIIYSVVRISTLSTEIASLSEHLIALDTRLGTTTQHIAQIDEGLKKANSDIDFIEEKVGRVDNKVGSVSSTVTTLQKLSATDPQLLAKYSKVFFLNENYAPERVTEVIDPYKYSAVKAVSVQADVWTYLKRMIDDARNDGINLFVSSGYRPFAEQKNLKSDYKVTYGAGTANQFSADQGYSEHQLGTAVDFTTTGMNGALDGFEKTSAYQWLLSNAHKYGFVISYPQNNQFYMFEPWHWRFVGVKLATDLKNQGKYFYDMDQRTIDTYLVSVF